jgi:hypothetical protein
LSGAWKLFLWDIALATLGGLFAGALVCAMSNTPITIYSLSPWALIFAVGSALLQLPWRFKKSDTDN